jgi:arylsulfatase
MVTALCGWALLGGEQAGAPTGRPPAGAPNLLVVTLDTTRADRIGAYGAEVSTPAFDAIAGGGALFLNASAVLAVTGPSHASMFTGSGPWDHGVLLNGVPIPEDRVTLAQVLHANGYNTGAFVSSYVLDGDKGFGRGFQVYDDDFGLLKGGAGLTVIQAWDMARRHLAPDAELERRGGDTVEVALAWMEAQQGATFTWVHLFDAHGPYAPPPPFDTRYYAGDARNPANTSMAPVKNVAAYLKRSLEGITDLNWVLAQYDGEISYADSQIARLLAGVDAQNTLVVVIADHGEQLGENNVWFNHGDDVYETSVHVPFALRWPGRVPAGLRVEQPFEGTDLAPTLLEAIGIPRPPSMTGASAAGLVGLGKGDGRQLARSLCFDREANVAGRESGAIDKPKWKMAGIRDRTGRYVERETGGVAEYFDLSADPRGVTDVINLFQQTPDGAALLKLYEKVAKEQVLAGDAAARTSNVELSEEERKKLEALGYLDGVGGE